jgi:hypothetical protein
MFCQRTRNRRAWCIERTCLAFRNAFPDRKQRRRLVHPAMTRPWPNPARNLLRLAWRWRASPYHSPDESLCLTPRLREQRLDGGTTKRRRPDKSTIFQQPRFGRWFFTIVLAVSPTPHGDVLPFSKISRRVSPPSETCTTHATSLAECIFPFCALILIVSLKKSRSL